jgi:hypothetical protein
MVWRIKGFGLKNMESIKKKKALLYDSPSLYSRSDIIEPF